MAKQVRVNGFLAHKTQAARCSALTDADRAFYIQQAQAALDEQRHLRMFGTGIYEERAGRRRTSAAVLQLCEHNRRIVQFGRLSFAPSRWADAR